MLYEHPPQGIRDYATPANPTLLSYLESQVENYSTEDYQTPQVEAFCSQYLKEAGFPETFSFDPNDSTGEAQHVQAYKALRQALFQFEYSGGLLERLEKPLGAHDWIKEQELKKERERIERDGQDEAALVSEVETDDSDGNSEGEDGDDGFIIDLNAIT